MAIRSSPPRTRKNVDHRSGGARGEKSEAAAFPASLDGDVVLERGDGAVPKRRVAELVQRRRLLRRGQQRRRR